MSQEGYNRVEILILFTLVIAVVTAFLFFFFDVQKTIRDTKRRGDIETIARELEVHYNNLPDQHCQSSTNSYCQVDDKWFNNGKVPVDPLTGEPYLYLPKNGDLKFMICAKLEKSSASNAGYYYCSNSQQ